MTIFIGDDPVVGGRQGANRLKRSYMRHVNQNEFLESYQRIIFNRRFDDEEIRSACHWLNDRINAELLPPFPLYEDWAWVRSPTPPVSKGDPYTKFYFGFRTDFFDVEFRLRYG